MKTASHWPKLLAITDLGAIDASDLVARFATLCSAARAGTVALLLRDHSESARTRLELGRALRQVSRNHGQALWLADRLDLALLLEADAVHLGEASVSVVDARKLLPHAAVSRALHSEEPCASVLEADALLVSPIFAPRKGRSALGTALLTDFVQRLAPRPVYALGGIDARTAPAALAAGAAGVAAMGAVSGDDALSLLASLGITR